MSTRQRVVVVTGGGGGIGAAIAQSVARTGAIVVTVDPMVSVDGCQQLPAPDHTDTTAGRIVAAGGAARASNVSVTDRDAVQALCTGLAEEFGGLDAVVNVAGISRPTGFAHGSAEDWRRVLEVHLDGYHNVLAAALPLMVAAGRGHILGVTSGSGWRAADAGAYSCAKRAVAALTWQLGRHAPEGVVVNAVSPIAATRMVTAALAAARPAPTAAKAADTGGLSLSTMPAPEDLGPLCAHLIADDFTTCRGRVLFAGGSEVAVIDEPRLLEVVGTAGVADSVDVLDAASAVAFAPAEAGQVSRGGSNARFGSTFTCPPGPPKATSPKGTCAVVTDRPEVTNAVAAALATRGATCTTVTHPDELTPLRTAGNLTTVLVALSGPDPAGGSGSAWERILAEHDGIAAGIDADATWARIIANLPDGQPIRLITVTDATTTGGRSRAQASAQLARAAAKATKGRVAAFAVSAETADFPADLVTHLATGRDAAVLAGAELVAGAGWCGLRSHPRPIGAISYGGPDLPAWFDQILGEVVDGP